MPPKLSNGIVSMEKTSEKNISLTIEGFIEAGAVYEAGLMQGHACFLEGLVVVGNRIGRNLGYPTANLKPFPGQIIPAQGVYVALVNIGNSWFESMVNIGIRPTLDLENVTIEAHLFDFNEDIYGEIISIHFLERIRDEMRFPSLGALKDQLEKDQEQAHQILSRLKLSPESEQKLVLLKPK